MTGESLPKEEMLVRYLPQNMENNKFPIFEEITGEMKKNFNASLESPTNWPSHIFVHSILQENGFFYESTKKCMGEFFIDLFFAKLKNTNINKILFLSEPPLSTRGLTSLLEGLKETKVTSFCLPLYFTLDSTKYGSPSDYFDDLIQALNNNTHIDTMDLSSNFINDPRVFDSDREVFKLGEKLLNNLPNEKKRIIILKDNDGITEDMKSELKRLYTHIDWVFDNDQK